eukprot:CAMPEP_0168563536 /NCGR_PEP_ID=MMETSP0413-20121227/12727_1 /TAXON_ID=136452 /ORGANISM="Filamoeba nolandi, Strain NC-AS-23-1" /LENGTH=191 /DNA_ID=CAMNT_0008595073 /DNA_START=99 /DNA_END=674 /DNA_ORIENTATION=-
MAEQVKKTVLVPIANGSEEIEAVSIIDTLRRAQAEVTVASVEKQLNVVCSRGVKIEADALITDCIGKNYDLIVLPGGMPGATNLKENPQLKELLQNQKQQNKLYGAICAAPAVVLQNHGLLDGKNATCHPNFVKDLTNSSKADSRVVVDGNVVTSRAPGTSLEFALTLVEILYGKETAKKVAEPMLVANWA